MLEINWKPNRKLKVPVYEQIADYIATRIISGEWPVGVQLPPQRELAKIWQVNRSTIVTALEELKSRGYVETAGKSGTQVCRRDYAGLVKQPNWVNHIQEGIHYSNIETIQQINRLEFQPGMIRLSSGEVTPELYPAEDMKKVLHQIADNLGYMGYEEPKGMIYLREQVCKYLLEYGVQTSPECVLIVSGALQAIQLVTMGLLQQGTVVLMERPSYLYSLNILPSMGMRRYGIPVDQNGLKAELLETFKIRSNQAILYVNPNFQNPTGTVMSLERRKKLMEICGREQIPVVEDDVYRELWLDKPLPPTLKSMDKQGLVLHVGSVSKILSPGLRIGWVVGPEPVIDRLSDLKMQADYGSSSLAQLAVARWLEGGYQQKHNQQLREHLKFRRDAALEALQRYFSDIARWQVPDGGYYVWVEVLIPVRMQRVFQEAVKLGVLFYPGYLYDTEASAYLRISYSYGSFTEIDEGIKKLAFVIKGQLE